MSEPEDESESEWVKMQAALGRAISAWGSIEGNLSVVFERAVTGDRSTAAQAAFSAILSFEAQLSMTDAAMKMAFANKADILDQWKALAKRIDKLRPKRNRLAHGQIVRHTKNFDVRMVFMPFFHVHQIHREMVDFEQLTVADLSKLFEDFMTLSNDLRRFHNHTISPHEMRKKERPKPSP